MKKYVLLFLFIHFSCLAGVAQESHLDFMGFPMGVTIDDFTKQLRQRYPLQKRVGGDRYYIYKGSIYGRDSYLKAEYTKRSRLVYKITVTPKFIDQNALADSLVAHYGEAIEVQNGMRWNVEGGTIFLYMPQGYDPVLMYFDEQAVAKFREEGE
ncbi:MAG: hypothetical protein ILA39_03025 [Bacteroidaceae bacterium]|nr:hypothetical protein [Bacteroidaceae bacterium]